MVQKRSMAFVRVGSLKLLPPGSATHFEIGGGDAVAVCNVAGVHGALDGPILNCPFHAWEFDCRTGVNTADEDLKQATYPVKVEDGEIFVDLP